LVLLAGGREGGREVWWSWNDEEFHDLQSSENFSVVRIKVNALLDACSRNEVTVKCVYMWWGNVSI
jgi:hypothetical protein